MLWLRSLKYFRGIEEPGRDSLEGFSEIPLEHCAKPASFACEREWRLVVFLPAPLRLLDDTLKPHVGNLQGVLRLMPPA